MCGQQKLPSLFLLHYPTICFIMVPRSHCHDLSLAANAARASVVRFKDAWRNRDETVHGLFCAISYAPLQCTLVWDIDVDGREPDRWTAQAPASDDEDALVAMQFTRERDCATKVRPCLIGEGVAGPIFC